MPVMGGSISGSAHLAPGLVGMPHETGLAEARSFALTSRPSSRWRRRRGYPDPTNSSTSEPGHRGSINSSTMYLPVYPNAPVTTCSGA